MPLLLLTLLLGACSAYDRIRQMRTFADMQTIVYQLEELRSRDARALADPVRVHDVLSRVAAGRDAWGTELIYYRKIAGKNISYVLVSLGSDRKPDAVNPEGYFSMSERIIHDEPWRDIVFRNGQPITRAGK